MGHNTCVIRTIFSDLCVRVRVGVTMRRERDGGGGGDAYCVTGVALTGKGR